MILADLTPDRPARGHNLRSRYERKSSAIRNSHSFATISRSRFTEA
jgi:hypothetical protein